MGKFKGLVSPILIAATVVLFFQNCSQVNFNSIESALGEQDFLLMKVNGESTVTLELGKTYSLEVSGSENVQQSGLNVAESKLVKIAGSCAAENMQPWTANADPLTEVAAVTPLLNNGLSVAASSGVDINSLGFEIYIPMIEIPIPTIVADPNAPITNNPDTNLPMTPDPAIGGTVRLGAGGLQNKMMNQALSSGSEAMIINLGTRDFVYDKTLDSRLNGCRWLGCVQSGDPKLETCVELKTQSEVVTNPAPPTTNEVVTVTTTTLPAVNFGSPIAADCVSMGGENIENGCRFHNAGNFKFTVPAGVSSIKVTAIGGGGGASSRDYSHWSGAHGGGGGAAIKTFTVNSGEVYDLTVGAGGSGGAGSSGLGWGQTGTEGQSSVFNHPATVITGTGGKVARWQVAGGRVPRAVVTPAAGGDGTGGDVNCKGGVGSFCLNGYFYCHGGDAPVCEGVPSGKSLNPAIYAGNRTSGGGGGGASEYGGNGISTKEDFNGCGGGGGEYVDQIVAPENAVNFRSRRGSHGCVVIKW